MRYTPEEEDPHEPNLVEMTEKALQILKKGKHGFFLLVEGQNQGWILGSERLKMPVIIS